MYKVVRKLAAFAFFVLPFATSGQELPVSAIRAANQPWQQALAHQSKRWTRPDLRAQLDAISELLIDAAADANALPEWPGDLDSLNSLNAQARASRRYPNPNKGDYQRRAAWLYPVDGCYAKAAHVSAEAVKRGVVKPGKVFAYGDLEYKTPYARNGKKTYWSYHVAAAYRMNGAVMVLDPMINPGAAMPLASWLAQISAKPSAVKIKYCDANAYSPSSKCVGSRGNGAYTGHMRGVLINEWNNLIRLGKDPTNLLAPQPIATPVP